MNVRVRRRWQSFIALLGVSSILLLSIVPVGMALPGQLRLSTTEGTYVDYSEDAWLHESYITRATSFGLDITNHNGGDIHYLYLLVAVDRNPAGNVTVKISGTTVGPYDGVITSNNKALVTETEPDYSYPGHGIYIYGSDVRFEVVPITIPGDGILKAGETISVPVEITPINAVKVHFDAVGADRENKAIAFVAPSEDVTHQVPEFTTIAIPVAAIIGLLFFFNHRKHRKP